MAAEDRYTLDVLAAVVGGELVGGDPGTPVVGITTDSRAVTPGEAFVAVAGERFDGHDYAAAALSSGATVVIVGTDSRSDCTPRIEVADTLTALRDLAASRRRTITVPVVAVTGSTGKTSTKDLLAGALPGAWASPRSYNNEVGVPLTVLGAPQDAPYLVLEVGSRGRGHIRWLAPAVKPDVAIVTNLGLVHLETFGTEADLADAKWELVEALEDRGTAVLPIDEPRLDRRTGARRMTFGPLPSADVSWSDLVLDDAARPSFTLQTPEGERRVTLGMAGAHQAANAAAAAAAGLAVGVDLDDLAAGLETAEGSAWRMEIHRGRFTVVNDSYNANPTSMEAAMRAVTAMRGRKLAVLGEMAELGPVEEREHARIGALARDLGFAALVVVGDDHGLAAAAGPIARKVPDADAALEVVRRVVRDGDVVLVKASRAVGLDDVALHLVNEAAS